MKRLLPLIFIYLSFIFSQGAFTNKPQGTEKNTSQEVESQTTLRPLLAMMKLDLENFENGLANSDETYWCEPMVNNGEAYTAALVKDLESGIQTSLTETAVDAFSEAFSTLYNLCSVADAQDYIDDPQYLDSFNTIAEIREIAIDEWP